MVSFFISLILLVVGYFVYGKFVEKVFGPDDRKTPALRKADGVDFMVLPNWKIFMIQFLNIAGTGPIFGAIMGAKFGPASYLWIVFGCIFAGSVHDYLSGMLSMRHGGVSLPTLVGHYLGRITRDFMLLFTVFLMIMVGAVFVYSPAAILSSIWGSSTMWIIVIFIYYLVATLLPVDKIIGKIYPIFAFSLFFMAAGLLVVLCIKMPDIPEIWDGVGSRLPDSNGSIFPYLFITIACGAISGFHATQSPLMARCMKNEHQGRPIFYGAMISEGAIALIWAAVASYFFYAEPSPGYELIEAAKKTGFATAAPNVVNIICNEWLGIVGGILAMLGVVAAPITSGDTALRSARLIIADFLKLNQKHFGKRLIICVPLFAATIALLLWQIENPDGFNVIWQYFGWYNQTISVFTLWTLTVYLARKNKPYIITLVPAVFMTCACSTFIFVSPSAFGMDSTTGTYITIYAAAISLLWFFFWKRRHDNADKKHKEKDRIINMNYREKDTGMKQF
ncbi:MAG: carbon starvation protein A [Bacteroidaceae bacterium]|nr:carbon starvation protein A [Bacteroidaceae bacterium]